MSYPFDGTLNSYMSCGAVNPTAAVSCGGWFRQTGTSQWLMGTMNYDNGAGKYGGYHLLVQASGVLTAFCSSTGFTGAANGHHYRTGNTAVNDGAWHHLALTWAANTAAKIYIDGVEDSYATDYPSGSYPSSLVYPASSDLYLGCVRYTGGSYLACATADLADAFVTNTQLTVAELKEIMYRRGSWQWIRGLQIRSRLLGDPAIAPVSIPSDWGNVAISVTNDYPISWQADTFAGGLRR